MTRTGTGLDIAGAGTVGPHWDPGRYGKRVSVGEGRYGGWGSGDWGYGAIEVNGQGTSATIDHATITSNESSGIKMYLGGATVTASTIANNGLGIAMNQGWMVVKDRSTVNGNTKDGLWFKLTSSYCRATRR